VPEPSQLGRYVVERVLGRGAMGVVYLARDPVIGRRVALKTLTLPADPEEAEEFRQRFLREAQAAGILNHPGIVTVHDAGLDDATGLSYIAMEFIEGRSLKDYLRAGHGFAYSEVARIGAALAAALDYAHTKGVVHRDIKPANVILTPQGIVKITDFGVARLESSNLTATGQFIGTPNYMSPEQVTGSPVDGRSDLFSLGVVLFELLTGQRPFAGTSLTEVSYKIVHEPAAIPSQVRHGVPPAFNPIVLKLLEKDASRRYARGADVARALDALRRILAGVAGEVAPFAAQPGVTEPAAVTPIGATPTATRATEVNAAIPHPPLAAPREEAGPSVWKRPIALRWAVVLLALVTVVPALTILALAQRIDRGPFAGPPPGEAARRYRLVLAERQAAAAIAAGRPGETLDILKPVFRQAPYSVLARNLRAEALALEVSRRDTAARTRMAEELREEGKALLRAGRWGAAEERFARALDLVPDDGVTRDYLEVARERMRMPRAERMAPAPVAAVATPVPTVTAGDAQLQFYFNCPVSVGSYELRLDGQLLSAKPFDFRTKTFMFFKKKGSGVIEDAFTVRAGQHKLLVRLTGAEGGLLGEQTLPVTFAAGGRYVLKIEMESEQSVPRFYLTTLRSR
jgi:predicted Ser/Thr protein kinase